MANMKDLTNPAWIKAKGLLFLFLGVLSAILLFLEHPTLRVAGLLHQFTDSSLFSETVVECLP
jgi:hypothetical protein